MTKSIKFTAASITKLKHSVGTKSHKCPSSNGKQKKFGRYKYLDRGGVKTLEAIKQEEC